MEDLQKQAVEMALQQTGKAEVKVGGYSMWPFIQPGDVIQITTAIKKPYFGRVAVFWVESQLIAHRITGQKFSDSNRLFFKISADFSKNSTSFIPASEIIGLVSSLKRQGQTKSFWLTPPFAKIAVFLSFFIKRLNYRHYSS